MSYLPQESTRLSEDMDTDPIEESALRLSVVEPAPSTRTKC